MYMYLSKDRINVHHYDTALKDARLIGLKFPRFKLYEFELRTSSRIELNCSAHSFEGFSTSSTESQAVTLVHVSTLEMIARILA